MIRLLFVMFAILLLLKMKKPLYAAVSVGSIVAVLLYGIPWKEAGNLVLRGAFQKETLELLAAFYGINLLQKSMEIVGKEQEGQDDLSLLFPSRRISIMVVPFLIGLLPSAGALFLAAPVVERISRNYLTKAEKAFVTSYYRHISESFLPTYSYIILAVNLSGGNMGMFQAAMMPSVLVLFLFGYLFYIRKIPNMTYANMEEQESRLVHIRQLLRQYWAILLLVVVILAARIPVYVAVYPVVVLYIFFHRFRFGDIKETVIFAWQLPIILDTIIIMIFKEILLYSDIFGKIPEYLETVNMPPIFVFMLLFFAGTLIMGSQATIALGIPLAFAGIPDGGVGLLVLAVGAAFIASQMSPTHVCLTIAVEYFHCSFWDLVKKTLLPAVSYLFFLILYSLFLCAVF